MGRLAAGKRGEKGLVKAEGPGSPSPPLGGRESSTCPRAAGTKQSWRGEGQRATQS